MKNIHIERFPKSNNSSLKAWSSADELIIEHIQDTLTTKKNIGIYYDRFGFLAAHLWDHFPTLISNYKSQEDGITLNLHNNHLTDQPIKFYSPIEQLPHKLDIAVLRVPKSMLLFRLLLQHIHQHSTGETIIFAGFMTKYFTKQMIDIAKDYFEDVSQSLAKKKARILILKTPKLQTKPTTNTTEITYPDPLGKIHTMQQYYGVFSSDHIDYATQFFLKNLKVDPKHKIVIDVASGNGIIGHFIQQHYPIDELHLIDDAFLAIESSKLNIDNATFYYNHNLIHIDDCTIDLVVCNPPFHFEHENTIEIALALFRDVKRVLKPVGEFQCVANRHLNYKTHLSQIFDVVDIVAENNKFVIYRCK